MSRTFIVFVLLTLCSAICATAQESPPNALLSEDSLQTDQTERKGCPIRVAMDVDMPLLEAEDRQLVREALNLDGLQRFPECAYSAKSDTNRYGKRVEQFIPKNEPIREGEDPDQVGWTLISVEGKSPSARQLENYRHSGGSLYPHNELVGMIDFSRLEVAERTSERVVFESRPTRAFLDDEKAGFLEDHVTITFVIELKNNRLDFLTTKLDAPIKPNAFMRVHEFDQYLDFNYLPEVGEVVLTELRMRADVKFVVVRRKFHLYAELSDFSCPVAMQPSTCEEPVLEQASAL